MEQLLMDIDGVNIFLATIKITGPTDEMHYIWVLIRKIGESMQASVNSSKTKLSTVRI